jgi:hypothetical protein
MLQWHDLRPVRLASQGGARNFGLDCEVCEVSQPHRAPARLGRDDAKRKSFSTTTPSLPFSHRRRDQPAPNPHGDVRGDAPPNTRSSGGCSPQVTSEPLFDQSVIITGNRTRAVLNTLVRRRISIGHHVAHGAQRRRVNGSRLTVSRSCVSTFAPVPFACGRGLRHLARLG